MDADLEYELFLQDLAQGKVTLDDPEFNPIQEEIQSISSLVESWNQPINPRKKDIQDFESFMDPLLIDYMNAVRLKLTESEIAKIEIYDLVYAAVKRFAYIQDAKSFLMDSKYKKKMNC